MTARPKPAMPRLTRAREAWRTPHQATKMAEGGDQAWAAEAGLSADRMNREFVP